MTTPITQPTTDEVERIAREMYADTPSSKKCTFDNLSKSTKQTYFARAKWYISKTEKLRDEINGATQEIVRLCIEIDDAHTHSAKLREENEGLVDKIFNIYQVTGLINGGNELESAKQLRSQNELLQSQLSRCVEVLAVELDEAIVQQDETTCVCKYCHVELVENAKHEPNCIAGTIGLLLTLLPTTPNLVERVREVEKPITHPQIHLDYYNWQKGLSESDRNFMYSTTPHGLAMWAWSRSRETIKESQQNLNQKAE